VNSLSIKEFVLKSPEEKVYELPIRIRTRKNRANPWRLKSSVQKSISLMKS
jgi:hypothetical protein